MKHDLEPIRYPYAPSMSAEVEPAPVGAPRPTRHWFWKVVAVVFAAEVSADTFFFLFGSLSPEGVVNQGVHVLACVGVLAYAFSKKLRRRWIWRHIWWVFPGSELVAYLVDRSPFEPLWEAPSAAPLTFVPLTFPLMPFCVLALHRLSRSRVVR